jgi:hypothetical protein
MVPSGRRQGRGIQIFETQKPLPTDGHCDFHISKWRQSISFGIFLHCFNFGCQPFNFVPGKNSQLISSGDFFSFLEEKLVARAVSRR